MSEPKLEQSLKSQVLKRTATEADVPFIFNSWLKSYHGSLFAKNISNPVYFQFQHLAIERLLKQCNVDVLCNVADNSQIFGYVVHEKVDDIVVIHYAYVKHSFRKMGLCNMLLQGLDLTSGGFYTHDTQSGSKLIRAKQLKLIYNPYLAFGVS